MAELSEDWATWNETPEAATAPFLVHMAGPDDIYYARDWREAVTVANLLNSDVGDPGLVRAWATPYLRADAFDRGTKEIDDIRTDTARLQAVIDAVSDEEVEAAALVILRRVTHAPFAALREGPLDPQGDYYRAQARAALEAAARARSPRGSADVLNEATKEANIRYRSHLVEDYDGDRFEEDEYGYDQTAPQAFVAGALFQAGLPAGKDNES